MTDEQFKLHMEAMKDICEKLDSINFFLGEQEARAQQNAGYPTPVEIMKDHTRRG